MFDANQFCVFIISHHRAEGVKTYRTIRSAGYTGKIYIVIDDQDKQIEAYKKRYGEEVVIFDKQKYIDLTDSGDNFRERGSPVYARNAIWDIAKDVGVRYFVVFDDDYAKFDHRFTDEDETSSIGSSKVLDLVMAAYVEFLESSGIDCIAMVQGGDYIGGAEAQKTIQVKRKVMNSFFCMTEKPFDFMSKLNDDVSTYVVHGGRGKVFLTSFLFSLTQMATQQSDGGITDLYKQFGTYVKSFYTVMFAPSCTKVKWLDGGTGARIHHSIAWNNAAPKIIRESFKR